MALDIELYRRTVYVPARRGTQSLRRISVIDIHPSLPPTYVDMD